MKLKPQEKATRARCWFVADVKCLVRPERRRGVFISYKETVCVHCKDGGLLCLSAPLCGKWGTKSPKRLVFSSSENTIWGGKRIVKSCFVRGKLDMWQSLLVWGRRHNSNPINYSISPNNHNYMGASITSHHENPCCPGVVEKSALQEESTMVSVETRWGIHAPRLDISFCSPMADILPITWHWAYFY